MKFLPFLLLPLVLIGCSFAAKNKLDATDLVTPYGTANTINAESDLNGNSVN